MYGYVWVCILYTQVGVLTEVPIMLSLVAIAKSYQAYFPPYRHHPPNHHQHPHVPRRPMEKDMEMAPVGLDTVSALRVAAAHHSDVPEGPGKVKTACALEPVSLVEPSRGHEDVEAVSEAVCYDEDLGIIG